MGKIRSIDKTWENKKNLIFFSNFTAMQIRSINNIKKWKKKFSQFFPDPNSPSSFLINLQSTRILADVQPLSAELSESLSISAESGKNSDLLKTRTLVILNIFRMLPYHQITISHSHWWMPICRVAHLQMIFVISRQVMIDYWLIFGLSIDHWYQFISLLLLIYRFFSSKSAPAVKCRNAVTRESTWRMFVFQENALIVPLNYAVSRSFFRYSGGTLMLGVTEKNWKI